MKIIFKKDEDSEAKVPEVRVYEEVDGSLRDFSYLRLIESLIHIEPISANIDEDKFTDAESESISRMVKEINEKFLRNKI